MGGGYFVYRITSSGFHFLAAIENTSVGLGASSASSSAANGVRPSARTDAWACVRVRSALDFSGWVLIRQAAGGPLCSSDGGGGSDGSLFDVPLKSFIHAVFFGILFSVSAKCQTPML